jgi:2-methylisocitrate lyase-like PEP mutase family enzyme
MEETARSVIQAAGNVPVIIDGDTGFGGANNIRRTIRRFASTGAAAVSIEDQMFPKKCTYAAGSGVRVVSTVEAGNRIRAAVAARDEARTLDGNSILIVARTDCRAAFGLEEAINRCKLFEELGADIVYAENLQSREEYVYLRACLKKETKTMLAQVQLFSPAEKYSDALYKEQTNLLSSDEVGNIGYDFVLFGVTALQATIQALKSTAHHMLSNKGLVEETSKVSISSFEEVKKVIDFSESENFESQYGT